MARFIYVVHVLPGRLRLRLPWLREHGAVANALAEGLLALEGMEEVEVRPFTGSVLCQHDPDVLETDVVVAAVKGFTGIDLVVRPGEEPPEEETLLEALVVGSDMARAVSRFAKGIDLEVLRATQGKVGLGVLTSLSFVAAGATKIIATRRIPTPDWFSLAWWAFATFNGSERAAINNTDAPVRGGAPESSPVGTRDEDGVHP
ncbi:hypothetical protein LZ198_30635 [Myxococcus sp. K15C18031901]|uniref:HMA2 domain-containing protein n=1 Tax=Myxococcus dinghuensis TaxID=2906761 RepID=UPI0020A7E30C|nr:hypothetical protein [Myxococcus dinghuensis]MCP3103246.1 hypothetical protein [Myxococcus dinghuensis]